jgi:hypothetical protein
MATSVLQRKYYPTPASAASRLATYSAFGSSAPICRTLPITFVLPDIFAQMVAPVR